MQYLAPPAQPRQGNFRENVMLRQLSSKHADHAVMFWTISSRPAAPPPQMWLG